MMGVASRGPAVRAFATALVFGREEGAREIWEPLVARIRARTHLEPDGYALAGDEAGNRRFGDFDFWVIWLEGGAPRWTGVVVYEYRTSRLFR
jgi:hypothetical protein